MCYRSVRTSRCSSPLKFLSQFRVSRFTQSSSVSTLRHCLVNCSCSVSLITTFLTEEPEGAVELFGSLEDVELLNFFRSLP